MRKMLLLSAVLGLSVSGASACPMMRSVEKSDAMTTASTAVETLRSTPAADTVTTASVAIDEKAE